MTIETKTDATTENVVDWARDVRRRGERADWAQLNSTEKPDEELVFPFIAPPPVWPRVFPGI